jgi:hypothetical protein
MAPATQSQDPFGPSFPYANPNDAELEERRSLLIKRLQSLTLEEEFEKH